MEIEIAGLPHAYAIFFDSMIGLGGTNAALAIARYVNQTKALAFRLPSKEFSQHGSGFLGRKGFELKNTKYQSTRNHAQTIQNQPFSGHALDQMQNRGLIPSVVESTIKTGHRFPTKAGTIGYYSSTNNVRVILNTRTGRVITVIPGEPK